MTDRARQRDRSPISTGDSGAVGDGPRRRRPVAFGVHQLIEYLLALALVVVAAHIGRSDLLLAAAVVFGVLALTSRGPLGLVRACGPRLHAVLDVTAAILLALAPLLRPLRPGVIGIVVIEVVAVAWLRLATLTRYSVPSRSEKAGAEITGPSANDIGVVADRPTGSTQALIRTLGRMTAGAQKRMPEAKTTIDAGARQAGAHAGRLQRAWRRATR